MTQTAQPLAAAGESESMSRAEAIGAAAEAFKSTLAAPVEALEEEFEAEAGVDETAEEAESRNGDPAEEEAADEAQPTETALPRSWPAEQAELWESLPPEAQAFIAEREGQRDRAVNARFQEAANVLKANEAVVTEANSNRRLYAEAADLLLSLVRPQRPPLSMLDKTSDDYDPDSYHLLERQYQDGVAFLDQHRSQLSQLRAQEQSQRFNAINDATRAAFVDAVPEAADRGKAPAVFQELIDYAVGAGAPAELFQSPTTALEWHMIWKAREYDRLQSAKAKVRGSPRPEPRKAPPAVRPGVTTSRGAIEHQRKGQALERLRQSGSVADGAAALKHLLKGQLS